MSNKIVEFINLHHGEEYKKKVLENVFNISLFVALIFGY